ncbi:MAG: cation:proton antiporter [Gemmatimonadota bacterium]|nr:cation:proton antiporter [Gemmatimonadota bacterium]
MRSLGYILVAAALVVLATRALRVPTIVAYIGTGLLLGPVTGLLAVDEAIDLISHVGIALLLFLVGLELSIEKIRDVGRVAVLAGAGQMLLTWVGGFAVSRLLGAGAVEAAFLATAVMFSSTVVVVKLLTQQGEIHALHGRISVGILLIQDVVVIIVLTLLAGLGQQSTVEMSTVTRGLLSAAGGMGLLLGAALLASRYVLPRLFGLASGSSETLFVWSLSWCFLLVLSAEALHLSPEIGAFLAGISLAQLPYNHELRRRVHPLMNFFIAVFFVSLGIQMDLQAAAVRWPEAVVLAIFVMVGKFAILALLIPRLGFPRLAGARAGITLSQISEFSFILSALALSAGLIDESTLALVGLVGLLTIAASSYAITASEPLARRFLASPAARLLPKGTGPVQEETAQLDGHVIVIGMNSLGRQIAHELHARGEVVVAVDTDPAKLAELPVHQVIGNAEHLGVLEEAQLERAKLLVSALQIEDANLLLAYRAREAGVPASIHAFDRSVVNELREIGVKHLMISKNAGIKRMARTLREDGLFGR